jgi:tetratricopeptide (TPR) repeat protein
MAIPHAEIDHLIASARARINARDPAAARALLERACAPETRNLDACVLLALACRMLGDHSAALAAVDAALAVDPYSYVALLSKGAALEESGQAHAAAGAYKAALALAPVRAQVPASLHASLAHAERAVRQDAERLYRHLGDALAAQRARWTNTDLKRFDECLALFSGRARRYVQEPSLLCFPQLPAIPFYDDALFPWMPALEKATDAIREELQVVMTEDWGAFHPYIQYPEGAPLRQWQALNHSPAWSAFELWRDGNRNDSNCRRCPRTAALLQTLPMAVAPGLGPTAMFSVLAPRTRIPPHTGSTNLRLIVHLPLLLPEGCRYRVGNDHRCWRLGKAWVFDDTIEHEATNDSEQVRVILMFDVWNPLVTEAERELALAMMRAARQFR